jgi:ATP-dependent Lon protease
MNDPLTNFPKVLPIVPIRNKVLLPGAALRLQIGRKDTVQLMQRIYRSVDNKESKYIIGCVPIQPPDNNQETKNGNRNSTPKKTIEETFNHATQPSDLHKFGCAARIIKLERTVSGFIVVVEGKGISLIQLIQKRIYWTILIYEERNNVDYFRRCSYSC